MDIQMKKGILEICVLSSLYHEDSYGYQILKDLSEIVSISESTLYPILRRLEKADFLETYSIAYEGRLRKYYRINGLGKEKIASFLMEWEDVVKAYNYIKRIELKEEKDNNA